jgi:aminoglycoside phosphotransferase (APT) family kinase protein
VSTSSTHYPAPSGLMCDDPSAVSAWLRAHGERVEGDVTIARTGFGQSNITTIVTAADGREWVLREPPPGTHAESAHDVAGEARIVASLAGTLNATRIAEASAVWTAEDGTTLHGMSEHLDQVRDGRLAGLRV